MSDAKHYMGWDIGGAHLKLACLDAGGAVLWAEQFPITLWQGLAPLRDVLASLRSRVDGDVSGHALTMTGELVDLFSDRDSGVKSLLDLFQEHIPAAITHVYAAGTGLLSPDRAREFSADVASANWHATGSLVARHCRVGILVDMGSTTTDILPFTGGGLCCLGMTDQERLRHDELVYTGIVRTPVMAIVQRAPFRGSWQNIAAEVFATMSDVYRILGELNENSDQMAAADGAGKTVEHSIRRLARMLGTDPGPAVPVQSWRDVAGFIAERQYQLVETAFLTVKARLDQTTKPVVVGAGSGRFVARRLAARHNLGYVDFPELLAVAPSLSEAAVSCATAISVARLLQESLTT